MRKCFLQSMHSSLSNPMSLGLQYVARLFFVFCFVLVNHIQILSHLLEEERERMIKRVKTTYMYYFCGFFSSKNVVVR